MCLSCFDVTCELYCKRKLSQKSDSNRPFIVEPGCNTRTPSHKWPCFRQRREVCPFSSCFCLPVPHTSARCACYVHLSQLSETNILPSCVNRMTSDGTLFFFISWHGQQQTKACNTREKPIIILFFSPSSVSRFTY